MKIKEWTEKEIDFLKNNYSYKSTTYCSEHLGRTKTAIRKRLKILGLECQGIKESKEIYKKENIEPIILSSKNFTEILIKLGKTHTGSNHETIKKYIKLYNIDTSHFETNLDRAKRQANKIKIPLEKILVKNSNYNRVELKNRLYKTGLKTRCCELCGQGEEWNGKKMSLILDHINGVNNDNRIENLRIVCPNCNATLDTHCGKNVKPNTCPDCNKIISNEAKRCHKCAIKNSTAVAEGYIKRRKVKIRPSYEDLMSDINSIGYVGTGKKFGVTDKAIKKWELTYLKQKEN